jgi:hypothetical protein
MIAVPTAALIATVLNEYLVRASSPSPMQQRAA